MCGYHGDFIVDGRWGEVFQGLEQNREVPHLTLGLTVSWDVTKRELSVIAERLVKQL